MIFLVLKDIYNSKGYVLGICIKCGKTNYVEPHGNTAQCSCSREQTEHKNIPNKYRDNTGNFSTRTSFKRVLNEI